MDCLVIKVNSSYFKCLSCCVLFISCFHDALSQEFSCFCYENDENGYVEWLCLSQDSAFVAAKMKGTCKEGLDFQKALAAMRRNDMMWNCETAEERIVFIKTIDLNDSALQLEHRYSCEQHPKCLKVELSYTPASLSFTSFVGPPESLLPKICFRGYGATPKCDCC